MDNIPIDNSDRVDIELGSCGPLPKSEEEFTKWVGAKTFSEAVSVTIRSSIENGNQTEAMFYQIKDLSQQIEYLRAENSANSSLAANRGRALEERTKQLMEAQSGLEKSEEILYALGCRDSCLGWVNERAEVLADALGKIASHFGIVGMTPTQMAEKLTEQDWRC